LCRPLADAAELQNKISDSRDSLKDTKDDVDKRGACSFRFILHINAKRWPRPTPLNDFRCYIFIASVTVFAALTLCLEHRLGKLRRAVQDASTEFAVADSKKMHLSARLQQDEDEMQALKDKVRYCRRSPSGPLRSLLQATQVKHVLAAGAVSGAQKLALMADKAKTQLQQTEAEVSAQKGSEQAMVERCDDVPRTRPCFVTRATG
jgi:hypothetical protein